jgi:hypothetical protein
LLKRKKESGREGGRQSKRERERERERERKKERMNERKKERKKERRACADIDLAGVLCFAPVLPFNWVFIYFSGQAFLLPRSNVPMPSTRRAETTTTTTTTRC